MLFTYNPQKNVSNAMPKIYKQILRCDIDNLTDSLQNEIIALADNSAANRINLLGIAIADIAYSSEAIGIEGIKKSSETNISHLKQFIADNIDDELQKKAEKLIPKNYKYINWQRDILSGHEWYPLKRSKDIIYGNIKGADIKIPWEIGRMQDLIYLSLAYSITQDEKYPQAFQNKILDFIASNPYGYGTQWITSMEVSIRAVNILVAYDMFKSAKFAFSGEFQELFDEMIEQHKAHIIANPEWSDGMRGNHYLANICSLIIIMIYQNDDKHENFKIVFDKLVTELEHQFDESGANFESSTYYHALSSEFVLWAFIFLAHKQSEEFRSKAKIRAKDIQDIGANIYTHYQFLKQFARPDGTLMQIGDNDSGTYLNLSTNLSPSNKMPLIELYEHVMNIKASDYFERFVDISDVFEVNEGESNKHNITDGALNSYGYIRYRENYKLFIRSGDKGQLGKGGHSHCDLNSICLDVGGMPVLVDPGTYQYTGIPELRNKYRSSEMHNTLTLKGSEQYIIGDSSKDDLFWLYGSASPKNEISADGSLAFIHSGYGKEHRRTLRFEQSALKISDTIKLDCEKQINLHFAPEVKISIIDSAVYAQIKGFSIKFEFPERDKIEKSLYYFSPGYGMTEHAEKIVLNTDYDTVTWNITINEDTGTYR